MTPRLGVTMGDPAGIGPEVVLKALAQPEVRAVCRPVVIGDRELLRRTAATCGLELDVEVHDLPGTADGVEPGRESAAAGEAAWRAIVAGVELARAGEVDALVTAPLNKVSLDLAGHGHEGHTELLQRLTGSPWSLTVFVLRNLRALYYTRHLSLRDAIDAVTAEGIASMLERFASVSHQLDLERPRIAVAALNPHAGEGGRFGREEIEQIAPGVERARAAGLDVSGPIPADSVFHQALEGRYDLVLGLYHDQVAAITKTVDFHGTVSITLGLPFLRFSVDHGTALDLAGQNRADARNMVETLRVAARYVR